MFVDAYILAVLYKATIHKLTTKISFELKRLFDFIISILYRLFGGNNQTVISEAVTNQTNSTISTDNNNNNTNDNLENNNQCNPLISNNENLKN